MATETAKETANGTTYNDLPRDCIFEIAKNFGLRDLFNFSCVDRRTYMTCEELQIKPLDGGHDLLPYQREYIKWMMINEKKGPHKGIISLTMGSGKTVTILTTIQLNRGGLTLVAVDLSLIPIWTAEIDKFYSVKDRLDYIVYHTDYSSKIDWARIGPNTVILTTPQTLKRRLASNEGDIQNVPFYRVVFDEVHVLGANTAVNIISKLKYQNMWVVSGTPMTTNPKLPPSFNKNISALFGRTDGPEFMFRGGRPIETPEVHAIPLNVQFSEMYHTNDRGKFQKMLDYVSKLTGSDKCLVFCNAREVSKVTEFFDEKGWTSYLTFDSSLSAKKRDASYSQFKTDPSIRVLVCTFTLAAKGLNLTEANHIIFVSTPSCFGDYRIPNSNELVQAVSRVYRYGQKKECFVEIYNDYKDHSSIVKKAFPRARVVRVP